MSLNVTNKHYDLWGITAAVLCLIHCLAFPLLLFIPMSIAHNPYIDGAFLLPGIWSVYKATQCRTSVFVKYLLWLSIICISVSVLLDMIWHLHSPLIYIGAAGLIIGHFINIINHKHTPSAC